MGSYKCDKYYGVTYVPTDNTGYETPQECEKYCIKNPDGTFTPTSVQATVAGEETTNVSNISVPSAVKQPTPITSQPKQSIFTKIKNVISMYFWYIVAIIFIIILAYIYSGGKKK